MGTAADPEHVGVEAKIRIANDGKAIDTAGQLITGEKFTGIEDLAQVLATSRRYGRPVPFLVMTSPATDAETRTSISLRRRPRRSGDGPISNCARISRCFDPIAYAVPCGSATS